MGIVASGPSCTAQDAQTLAGICDEIIAVNDSWRLYPACDHIWATDHRWWKHHIADVTNDYEGLCWTVRTGWPKDTPPEAWGITALEADTGAEGLSTDPDKVHTGKNSGYAAVNLALHLKTERIILLGYDMSMEGDTRHWFGAHPAGMEVGSDYNGFIGRFNTIKPEQYGIEIINCTRRTALTCFPCYNLEDVS